MLYALCPQAKLSEVLKGLPLDAIFYPKGFRGGPEVREAFAHLMKRTFMKVGK